MDACGQGPDRDGGRQQGEKAGMDDWSVALGYGKGKYPLHWTQCVRAPCSSLAWNTLHCSGQIYLEKCFYQTFTACFYYFFFYQNAEMCLIWELVKVTRTSSPCCAAAARQFCLFHPSFSLPIDESVIFGGKLLRIWSWSLVVFDRGALSLVRMRFWNHISLTGMSSILCFSHQTRLERNIWIMCNVGKMIIKCWLTSDVRRLGKWHNFFELFVLNFYCSYIPFDLLPVIYYSSLSHHYRSPSILCDWACSSPGAVGPRAEIALLSWLCGDAPCPLALVLLSSAVYQRLYSPRVLSADVKSEDRTCSLVAIIRKMSQPHGVAEDEERLQSSANMFGARLRTLTPNFGLCNFTDSAEMHLKCHWM